MSKGEKRERKRERERPRKRVLTTENKLMVNRGEIGKELVKQVMGIKEDTCCDEHWVIYGTVKSLYCTPETNVILYISYTGIKIKK